MLKRSGLSESPPTWFVLHVLASAGGCVLVALHAAGGSLLSPPGLLLLPRPVRKRLRRPQVGQVRLLRRLQLQEGGVRQQPAPPLQGRVPTLPL